MNTLGDPDLAEKIKALPADWWTELAPCHTFAHLFSRHLLGLHVVFKHRGVVHQDLYTGFAVYYKSRLMWLTAGHVIDEIDQLVSNPEIEVGATAWLDGCDISGAESVPAGALKDLIRFSATPQGFDFGVVSLDTAAMTLLESPSLQFLTEEVWRNHGTANPEGFYLVGFPAQWWKSSTKAIAPRQTFAAIRAAVACMPLLRIEREEPVCSGDFWDHSTAFYARVLGAPNVEGLPAPHLKGTSGGPIFSIERTAEGRMKYRLFGVQSACLESRPILRAESISDVLKIMA